jgi:hypothetical protein
VGLTQYPVHWLPGLKRPGCKAHLSPPSNADVKNGLIYTSVPHKYLYGVYRDSCAFSFIFPFPITVDTRSPGRWIGRRGPIE